MKEVLKIFIDKIYKLEFYPIRIQPMNSNECGHGIKLFI
jgi:hypothetical protein